MVRCVAHSSLGPMRDDRVGGFTVVELIAVLLLMGILAATATSRMVGSNAYAPALVSQQLIALGRLAQQTALARQDASVSLDVDQDAGDWRLRVQVDDGASVVDGARRARRSGQHRSRRCERRLERAVGNRPRRCTSFSTVSVDSPSGTVGATALNAATGVSLTASGDSTVQRLHRIHRTCVPWHVQLTTNADRVGAATRLHSDRTRRDDADHQHRRARRDVFAEPRPAPSIRRDVAAEGGGARGVVHGRDSRPALRRTIAVGRRPAVLDVDHRVFARGRVRRR